MKAEENKEVHQSWRGKAVNIAGGLRRTEKTQ